MLVELDYDINSIQIAGIRPVPRQYPPRQLTLQRGKAKNSGRVTTQNKLHQPVAEAADTVVKENRVRFRASHIENF
jgi:hypothetical protein